jgi:DNA-binding NtrC family response regulator
LSADLAAPSARREQAAGTAAPVTAASARNLTDVVEQVEKELIVTALGRARGNISETARLLGLTRRGLYLKMRRLRLEGVAADTK